MIYQPNLEPIQARISSNCVKSHLSIFLKVVQFVSNGGSALLCKC